MLGNAIVLIGFGWFLGICSLVSFQAMAAAMRYRDVLDILEEEEEEEQEEQEERLGFSDKIRGIIDRSESNEHDKDEKR